MTMTDGTDSELLEAVAVLESHGCAPDEDPREGGPGGMKTIACRKAYQELRKVDPEAAEILRWTPASERYAKACELSREYFDTPDPRFL